MTRQPWMLRSWMVVACVVLMRALSSGTRMSFGIALVPVSTQFGWTRTTLSTIALTTGIITSLLEAGMGVLADRVGPRRLLGGGVALLGLSVWLLTVSSTVWQFGLAYGLLGGVGLAATGQVVGSTLVANWFTRHRGLAQAMAGSAAAVGWMLVVPMNMVLEQAYGWTTMYRTTGTALLIGMLPLVWISIRDHPEDVGLRPYGADPPGALTPTTTGQTTPGVPLRHALRQSRTWQMVYLGFA